MYYQGYHGCAIGKAQQAAKTAIEKLKVEYLWREGKGEGMEENGEGDCVMCHC